MAGHDVNHIQRILFLLMNSFVFYNSFKYFVSNFEFPFVSASDKNDYLVFSYLLLVFPFKISWILIRILNPLNLPNTYSKLWTKSFEINQKTPV